MNTYYSKSENGFYPEAIKSRYIKAGTWPNDAVKLTQQQIDTYQGVEPPKGKILAGDLNGMPIWADLPQKSLSELKSIALSKAEQVFDSACDVITQNAPSKEIDSWKKQEDEARAWDADNTASTPLIDGLLISRGLSETKAQLVQKIIENADNWAIAYSAELGAYQSRVKRINATTATLADVQAVIDEMEPVA